MFEALLPRAERIAALLIARGEKVSVAESSAGGLISAALLAVPGASAYYVAGGVVYTPKARATLMALSREDVAGLRSASEPYALRLAETSCDRFATGWGLAETGAAGPTGNPYGDPAGHACVAVAGPGIKLVRTIATGSSDRLANMVAFAASALALLEDALSASA